MSLPELSDGSAEIRVLRFASGLDILQHGTLAERRVVACKAQVFFKIFVCKRKAFGVCYLNDFVPDFTHKRLHYREIETRKCRTANGSDRVEHRVHQEFFPHFQADVFWNLVDDVRCFKKLVDGFDTFGTVVVFFTKENDASARTIDISMLVDGLQIDDESVQRLFSTVNALDFCFGMHSVQKRK